MCPIFQVSAKVVIIFTRLKIRIPFGFMFFGGFLNQIIQTGEIVIVTETTVYRLILTVGDQLIYFFFSHNPSIDSSVFPLVSGTIFQTKMADRIPIIPYIQ